MSFFQSKTSSHETPPLPDELQLQLAPGESRQFAIRVDEECDVHWEISRLNAGAQRLPAGVTQTLTFALPASAPAHALIRGRLRLVRVADGAQIRSVPVAGWVRKPADVTPPVTPPENEPPKPPGDWWKRLLAILALSAAGLGVAAVLYFPRSPALMVNPAHINLGTIWYSPPVGGNVITSLVFTVQWRVAPHAAGNMLLIAREDTHYASDTGQQNLLEEITETPFDQASVETSVPVTCYNLTNETVQVNGTIDLTVSNAPAPVAPARIQFEALLKPASP